MQKKLTRLAIPDDLAQILAEVAAEDVAVLVANPGAGGVH